MVVVVVVVQVNLRALQDALSLQQPPSQRKKKGRKAEAEAIYYYIVCSFDLGELFDTRVWKAAAADRQSPRNVHI